MKKYIKIFQNHLQTSIMYRSNIVVNLLYELITVSSILILWFAIFRTRSTVGSYTFNSILLYYILAPFVGNITYVSLSQKWGEEIRFGFFSGQIIKPQKIWFSAFMQEVAYKLNTIIFVTPLYTVIVGLFLFYSRINVNVENLVIGVFFALMGFILQYTMDLTIAWAAFWMTDVWCFEHVKRIIFNIIGGRRFPLDLFSGNLRLFVEFLPFKFFYFLPVAYFLGVRSRDSILIDIFSLFLWSLFFFGLSQFLWKKGIKKYEAYGN